MSEPIRILIVEDLPADADLAMREIRKSLADCVFERVETEPDYLDALEKFKPDLILSDYHLPHFNGMEALKLALECTPLTPLIIYTGTLSEDTAVDCMKAGAANYIIKENIKRLGIAVVHTLEEKKIRIERDQAEKDLRESEKRFRTALQDVPTIAVQGYTMDGTTHYWNFASEKLYGYSAQEAIGRNLLDLIIPPEMRSGVRQAIQQMAETGQPIPAAELSLMRKDGSRVTVFSSHSIVPSIDGAPELFCLDVDLSERKRAERIIQMRNEDLALVNALNEAVNRGENIDRIVEVFAREIESMIPACRGAAVYLLDADSSHLEMRSLTFSATLIKKIEKLIGYTIPQIKFPIQKDGYFQKMLLSEQGNILGDPKTIQQWMSEFGEAISIPSLVRDGFRRFIPQIYKILKIHSVLTVRLTSSGNTVGLLEVVGESQFSEEDLNRIQNISGQVTEVILRRQAEDDLRRAEEKYRNIFENSLEGIFQSTPAGRYLTVNPALARMWGYDSPEDLINSVTDIAHQVYLNAEVRVEHMNFIKKHDGDLVGFEYQAQCKDGRVIWVSESVHSVRGADGELLYFEGVVEDISNRKQAEHIIQMRNEELALVNTLNEAVNRGEDIDSIVEVLASAINGMMPHAVATMVFLLDSNKNSLELRNLNVSSTLVMKIKEIIGIDIPTIKIPVQKDDFFQKIQKNERGMIINDPQTIQQWISRLAETTYISPMVRAGVKKLIPNIHRLLNVQSAILVPLASSEKLIGTLEVSSENLLTEEDLTRIQNISGQVTAVILRRQAEEKILRQLDYLTALRDIDRIITSTFDIHVSVDTLISRASSLLAADAVAILLVDSDTSTLKYAARIGFRTRTAETAEIKLGESYAGKAALEKRLIQIPDIASETDNVLFNTFLKSENFVSYYGMPLIVKEKAIGVLEVFQRSMVKHDQEWFDFFDTLAGQAAIAIDNAHLFEGLQRSNAELEERVDKRTIELNQSKIELERLVRVKDEFLANMSHELRTPLNGILGLSETLLEGVRGPLTEKQKQAVGFVHSSGEHLLELINDILDVSKIEAGMFELHPENVEVNDVCESSLIFIKQAAHQKSITVEYTPSPTTPKIFADRMRLKQILVNLLNNAVKFTPEKGKIKLEVQTDAAASQMRFSIIDTGIGITPEDLQRLFKPFVQLDSSLSRQYEGTGLGLALTKKLVEMHGGSIEVQSTVGAGSQFTFMLPWDKTLDAKHSSASAVKVLDATLRGCGKIMIADDNETNAMMVQDYLENHGYQVLVAHDGEEALQKAQEFLPNLILMDVQMPRLDGFEVTRRLRTDPRFASVPIIALTAFAMRGDRERCLEAGMDEYLSKPVRLKELAQMIENFLERSKKE